MAAILRHPLAVRPFSHQVSPTSSLQTVPTKLSSAKRSRSPDIVPDVVQLSKRPRGVDQSLVLTREESKKDKERRRTERETEFRVKYTKAFPTWVFYFDTNAADPETIALCERLTDRVLRMDARVDGFFSNKVTHLITSQSAESFANKENSSKLQPKDSPLLRSPIKLKNRTTKDVPATLADDLVKKAISFDIKIWSPEKLESVLNRCNAPPACLPGASSTLKLSHGPPITTRDRSLTRLLEAERIHGTTERDPTQKRNDYIYFSKSSYYVLVEDMNQELATIAALEYPAQKDQDGQEKGSWPVLHCHPKARGPFVEYNDREERRREKAEKQEAEREWERERRKARLLLAEKKKREQQQSHRSGDLRRSVSMNNLQRRASFPQTGAGGFIDLDADFDDEHNASANASGYLASGAYMAASGNSVSVTSTAGTTSTAGHSFRQSQLNSNLKGLMQQQVVTSRRASLVTTSAAKKENVMGPPPIPEKRNILLRKSRSTNTLRLPKREEGSKPGYCESCRTKFEDFSAHIHGRKHRKFATDDANFASLDRVLSRVRRRTLQEVADERQSWKLSQDQFDTESACPSEDMAVEDVQWDDWVENDDTL